MSFFGSATSTAPTGPAASQEKDVEVADPPSDSISSLAFSSAAEYLAVGSWDNNVRLYEVGAQGQSQGKAMYSHQGPVLSVCWNKVSGHAATLPWPTFNLERSGGEQSIFRRGGQRGADVRHCDGPVAASRAARRAHKICQVGRHARWLARYRKLGQNSQGTTITAGFDRDLTCHSVLGFADPKPYWNYNITRALLYHGRPIPDHGRRNGRAPHPGV